MIDLILDLIPYGNENPITRADLVAQTGQDDRTVRDAIKQLKRDYPIVNIGQGYYIAEDPDDPDLEAYIRQESHRIREISKGLRRHKALYRINKQQERLSI